jgi:transcription elongation factor GreA
MSQNDPVYLTSEGLEKLQKELEYLTQVKRQAITERLRHAIQQGDLAENADYISAKEEQGFLEGRIQQLEKMLRRATVIEHNAAGDQVTLGSRVTVIEHSSGEVETFRIVGPAEADPLQGTISYESPVGRALLGRRVGEQVCVKVPAGETTFEIVAII